jgi:hypothetical protein
MAHPNPRPADPPAQPRRGPRLLLWALLIALFTIGPLLLYIAFGPADGNPIGLGLLAMVGVPAAGGLALAGLIYTVVESALSRGQERRR